MLKLNKHLIELDKNNLYALGGVVLVRVRDNQVLGDNLHLRWCIKHEVYHQVVLDFFCIIKLRYVSII